MRKILQNLGSCPARANPQVGKSGTIAGPLIASKCHFVSLPAV